MSAPAGDASSSESGEYFTDADIHKMCSDLKEMPGINLKSVDGFANVLKKFRKNSSKDETIDGVVSDKNEYIYAFIHFLNHFLPIKSWNY